MLTYLTGCCLSLRRGGKEAITTKREVIVEVKVIKSCLASPDPPGAACLVEQPKDTVGRVGENSSCGEAWQQQGNMQQHFERDTKGSSFKHCQVLDGG